MENVAKKLYDSLNSFTDIENLIINGEAETQYLECKSPGEPRIDKGLKSQLAEAVSGFSNTGGGVIIWGISTTRHNHSGLDILSQIEEIGTIKNFKTQVDLAVISVSEPQITLCESKCIMRTGSSTRGVLVTLIPPITGDPIRSNIDGKFYMRLRDNFTEMPYETIKRMFVGTSGPDLSVLLEEKLVKSKTDGSWKIPILLENASSAVAKDIEVSVEIINSSSCDQISSNEFKDQSSVNPGSKVFMTDVSSPVFRGKRLIAGSLIVKMKKQTLAKRKLELEIELFASNMRAKTYTLVIQLAKSRFTVKKIKEDYLY